MKFENVTSKHRNEIEMQVRELNATLRKAKLQNEPVAEMLRVLETELADIRRSQFDVTTPEYQGF